MSTQFSDANVIMMHISVLYILLVCSSGDISHIPAAFLFLRNFIAGVVTLLLKIICSSVVVLSSCWVIYPSCLGQYIFIVYLPLGGSYIGYVSLFSKLCLFLTSYLVLLRSFVSSAFNHFLSNRFLNFYLFYESPPRVILKLLQSSTIFSCSF